jgi:hypothetical protein
MHRRNSCRSFTVLSKEAISNDSGASGIALHLSGVS